MRRIAAAGLLALTSCGRLDFESARFDAGARDATTGDARDGDATTGDARDGAATDAGVDCWAAWRAGTVQLTAPVPVTELNTAQVETNPSLADDGLTLYFDRGGSSNRDIYAATRPARGMPFVNPTALTSIDAPTEDDTRLSVTGDGLTGVFSSISSGINYRLYQTARASIADPFGAPSAVPFPQIDNNNNNNEVDAELTGDGLRLYFAPTQGGTQRIMLATRAAVDQAFGAPTAVAGVTVGTSTEDPSISPDELVIAFSSSDAQGLHVYYAARTDTATPFSNVTLVPGLESSLVDGDPELAADGCELFFDSERAAASDLFVAEVVR